MSIKIIKAISLILLPITLSFTIIVMYSNYLDRKISQLYNPALGRTYGVDQMNKGIKLLTHNANKDDLIILGSSELDAKLPQNPQYMFPNTGLDCDVDLVGRAAVQNLVDAIKVGALQESFEGKKIVLIISLQWFLGDDIDINGFKAHFSEVQFYKFMNSKEISHDNKVYVCERITKLLKNDSVFKMPYLYAKLYKNDNILSNIALNLFKPYYYLEEKFLELKDKHQSLKIVELFKDTPIRDTLDINWDDEEINAQKMGEEACINNKFYVYDEYYDTYLREHIDSLKNSTNPNLDLCASKEFDDYRLMLDTFKQIGIDPYIVFASTNGFYYDYIGLDRDKRIKFYDKLCNITNKYSFTYLDLRDKEYELYFYKDIMHLGWKGWLYVNKQITEHYS